MMEKKRSVSLLPALICLAGMAALLLLWRNAYQNAVFSRLSAFCGIFLEQNPQLEGEVLSALQEYQTADRKEKTAGEISLSAMDMRRRILLRPFLRLGLRERGKGEREG